MCVRVCQLVSLSDTFCIPVSTLSAERRMPVLFQARPLLQVHEGGTGGQMAEWLGSRAITQKVVGLIPACAK